MRMLLLLFINADINSNLVVRDQYSSLSELELLKFFNT